MEKCTVTKPGNQVSHQDRSHGNRLGLGLSGSAKSRVTHFQPYDIAAMKSHYCQSKGNSGGTVSPKDSTEKRQDTREWERRLRQYMNSDDQTLDTTHSVVHQVHGEP